MRKHCAIKYVTFHIEIKEEEKNENTHTHANSLETYARSDTSFFPSQFFIL